MKQLFRTVIALLGALSVPAEATICFPPDPEAIYADSSVVVFAIPKAISVLPKDAPKRGYAYPFRQTILWQVLVGWKGPYKAGSTFTTRTTFTDDPGCSSAVYRQAPLLLYLSGREPYILHRAYYPEFSVDQFKYLETLRHEP